MVRLDDAHLFWPNHRRVQFLNNLFVLFVKDTVLSNNKEFEFEYNHYRNNNNIKNGLNHFNIKYNKGDKKDKYDS